MENRPNALYRRFFGGRVYARQCPSRALLPLLRRAIDSRCARGVERANPGSLGRPSRVAACARSSGLHPLFCTILHWGSRRSARDTNFGRGFWSAFLYRYIISTRKQSGKRPPRRRALSARLRALVGRLARFERGNARSWSACIGRGASVLRFFFAAPCEHASSRSLS